MNEPVGGGLQPDRAGRDDQVTELHAGLESAAGADSDEGGTLGDRQDLADHDLDVVRADAGGHARDAEALVQAGRAGELPVAVGALDGIEARCDSLDAILVAGEEDVVRELTGSQPDVVLPLAGGNRDAFVRVRQVLAPSFVHARMA